MTLGSGVSPACICMPASTVLTRDTQPGRVTARRTLQLGQASCSAPTEHAFVDMTCLNAGAGLFPTPKLLKQASRTRVGVLHCRQRQITSGASSHVKALPQTATGPGESGAQATHLWGFAGCEAPGAVPSPDTATAGCVLCVLPTAGWPLPQWCARRPAAEWCHHSSHGAANGHTAQQHQIRSLPCCPAHLAW